MSSLGLIAFIMIFSLGVLCGSADMDAVIKPQASARADYLGEQLQQIRAINKAQAEELRRLTDERGE